MFMECLPGAPFSQLRDHLHLDDKKAIVTDVEKVLVELSALKFNEIGCLKAGANVGPLLHPHRTGGLISMGPFTSTIDYLISFLQPQMDRGGHSDQARKIIERYMSTSSNSSLDGPFRLVHDDLSAFNILVVRSDVDEQTRSGQNHGRLSGIIDWEYAETHPVYFLYDYPVFIQDSFRGPHAYMENKVLRQCFVKTLIEKFPGGSPEFMELSKSLNKCFTLNGFKNRIVNAFRWGEESDVQVGSYVLDHDQETWRAYEKGPEWLGAPDVRFREYLERITNAGLIDPESMYGMVDELRSGPSVLPVTKLD